MNPNLTTISLYDLKQLTLPLLIHFPYLQNGERLTYQGDAKKKVSFAPSPHPRVAGVAGVAGGFATLYIGSDIQSAKGAGKQERQPLTPLLQPTV